MVRVPTGRKRYRSYRPPVSGPCVLVLQLEFYTTMCPDYTTKERRREWFDAQIEDLTETERQGL